MLYDAPWPDVTEHVHTNMTSTCVLRSLFMGKLYIYNFTAKLSICSLSTHST